MKNQQSQLKKTLTLLGFFAVSVLAAPELTLQNNSNQLPNSREKLNVKSNGLSNSLKPLLQKSSTLQFKENKVQFFKGALKLNGIKSNQDPETIQQFLNQNISNITGLNTLSSQYKLLNSKQYKKGLSYSRFQLEYKNIPVFGLQAIAIQSQEGLVSELHFSPAQIGLGNAENFVDFSNLPLLWKKQLPHEDYLIFDLKKVWYAADVVSHESQSKLQAAWEFKVKSTHNTPFLKRFVIHAQTGKILFSENRLVHALNRSIRDFTSKTILRSEGSLPSGNADADSVYDFAQIYYQILQSQGRDSYDGAGATLISHVNATSYCPNAWWDDVSASFCPGLATKDVVVHEFTHALTSNTADLVYSGESGAMNESFSDLFGIYADQNFTIGEGTSLGIIRDASNPTAYGDPDHYTSYIAGGDVHTNSGIHNKMGYLLIHGGTHHGVSVTGIGFDDAIAIFYHELLRLTPNSTMADASAAAILAAEALFGAGSQQVLSTQQAFQAIGLFVNPNPTLGAIPDTLNFGEIYTQHNDTLSIKLSNLGIQTLNLKLNVIGSGFNITQDSFAIAGKSDSNLYVVANASSNGTFSAQLLLQSNDPIHPLDSIILASKVGAPPILTISRTQFDTTLLSGDSLNTYATVQNLGGSSLKLLTNAKSAGKGLIINEISSNPDMIEIFNFGPTRDISGYKFRWNDDVGTSGTYVIPNGTIIPSNKSIVFYEEVGTNSDSVKYMNMTLSWIYDTEIALSLEDPLGNSIDAFKTLNQTLPSGTWKGTGFTRSGSLDDIYRNKFVDKDSASEWSEAAITSPNAYNPGQENTTNANAGLISALIPETTLTPGSSIQLTFKVNSLGHLGGIHLDTLNLIHNDPAFTNPQKLIFSTTVVGSPQITHPDTLRFAQTWTAHTSQSKVWIKNPGSDTTRLSAWNVALPFSIINTPSVIAPFDSVLVTLGFTPNNAIQYNTSLTFQTNVSNKINQSIILVGSGATPPVATWIPTQISDSLSVGDSIQRGAWLRNDGGANLELQELTKKGIIISEVSSYPDFMELYNSSNQDISLAGYKLEWIDDTYSSGTYTFTNEVIKAKSTYTLIETGYYSDSKTSVYPYNLGWGWGSAVAVWLKTPDNTTLDFFKTSASNENGGADQWSGAGANFSNNDAAQRKNSQDNNTALDWVNQSSSQNIFNDSLSSQSSGGNWWNLNSVVQNIVPGDSLWFDITLFNKNLMAGTYKDTLSISANLPDSSTQLPMELRVGSKTRIQVSNDSLNFGILKTGTYTPQTLKVYNKGNTPLILSGISGVVAPFSQTLSFPYTLTPQDSISISITAYSLDTGKVEQQIHILSNADSLASYPVVLTTEFRYGAILSKNPTILTQSIQSGSADSVSLQLSNTGDAPLNLAHYWSNGRYARIQQAPQKILLFENQAGTHYYTQALNYLGWNYKKVTALDSLKTLLQTDSSWNLIVIMTDNNLDTNDLNRLKRQVNLGNQVIIHEIGAYYGNNSHKFYSEAGLTSTYATSYTNNIYFNSSEVLGNFPAKVDTLNYTSDKSNINSLQMYYNSSLANSWGTVGGYPAFIGAKNRSVIIQAFSPIDFDGDKDADGQIDMKELASNVLLWATRFKSLSNPEVTTITPNQVVNLQVALQAQALNGGLYKDTLWVGADAQSMSAIPLNLTVVGQAQISLSDSLHMNNTWIGYKDTASFTYSNLGTDTLKINTIVLSTANLQVTLKDSILAPGKSSQAQISLTPNTLGQSNGTLILGNMSTLDTLQIDWNGIAAPILQVTPDTLNVVLSAKDSIVRNIQIANIGSDTLSWETVLSERKSLLISEVYVNSYGAIEITNKSNRTISLTNYKLEWSSNNGYNGSFTLPNLNILPGKSIAFVSGYGTNNDSIYYMSTYTNWSYYYGVSIHFINPQGESVDYFRTSGAPIKPANAQWNGPDVYSGYNYYQRTSSVDSDSTKDWTYSDYTSTLGSTSWGAIISQNYVYSNPSSGSLSSGINSNIPVTIRSGNRLEGLYKDTLWVNTNLNGLKKAVVIQSQILGSSTLSLSADTLNFGTLLIGDTLNLKNTLINNGNKNIHIYSVNYFSDITYTRPDSILAFSKDTLRLRYTPKDTGTVTRTIQIVSDATFGATKTFILKGVVKRGPQLSVAFNSDSLFILNRGGSGSKNLQITNTGDQNLVFSTLASSPNGAYQIYASDSGKTTYVWNDISAIGNTQSGCDDCYWNFYLNNFNFPFYGNQYSSFYVSSNGMISFGTSNSSTSGSLFPSSYNPSPSLAAFWRDLNPNINTVHFWQDNNKAIVQFDSVALYSGTGIVSFQIVLNKNGKINLYYKDIPVGYSGVAGMQKDYSSGINFPVSTIHNQSALEIASSSLWLTPSLAIDTLSPGESSNLNLLASTDSTMTDSLYYSQFSINSNAKNGNWTQNFQLKIVEIVKDSVYIVVSVSGLGSINPVGSIKVAKGDSLKFTLTPQAGITQYWLDLDGNKVSLTNNEYILRNIQNSHNLDAVFIDPVNITRLESAPKIWSLNPTLSKSIDVFNLQGQKIKHFNSIQYIEFQQWISKQVSGSYILRDLQSQSIQLWNHK